MYTLETRWKNYYIKIESKFISRTIKRYLLRKLLKKYFKKIAPHAPQTQHIMLETNYHTDDTDDTDDDEVFQTMDVKICLGRDYGCVTIQMCDFDTFGPRVYGIQLVWNEVHHTTGITCQLFYRGQPVQPDDTPLRLGMEHNDIVCCRRLIEN